jgi:hypothetical protein
VFKLIVERSRLLEFLARTTDCAGAFALTDEVNRTSCFVKKYSNCSHFSQQTIQEDPVLFVLS